MKKNNNTRRRIRLTPDQQKEVATRYENGETTVELAKTYGVCSNAIGNAIRKQGGELRDRSLRARKYQYRPDAFDEESPEAAYWIGFLFADGSVPRYDEREVLSVGLQVGDREHLEKFQHFICSNHPLYETTAKIRGKTHEGVRLTITAPELVRTLRRHGMVLSLDRVAPSFLTRSKDFWRGMVDGDGHICRYTRTRESGNKHPGQELGLCGGFELMEQFLTFLRSHDVGLRTAITPEGSVFRVKLGASSGLKAMRLLYLNEMLSLTRKKNLVDSILEEETRRLKI